MNALSIGCEEVNHAMGRRGERQAEPDPRPGSVPPNLSSNEKRREGTEDKGKPQRMRQGPMTAEEANVPETKRSTKGVEVWQDGTDRSKDANLRVPYSLPS